MRVHRFVRITLKNVSGNTEKVTVCMDQDETQVATESQLDAAAAIITSLPDPPVTSLKIGVSGVRISWTNVVRDFSFL